MTTQKMADGKTSQVKNMLNNILHRLSDMEEEELNQLENCLQGFTDGDFEETN